VIPWPVCPRPSISLAEIAKPRDDNHGDCRRGPQRPRARPPELSADLVDRRLRHGRRRLADPQHRPMLSEKTGWPVTVARRSAQRRGDGTGVVLSDLSFLLPAFHERGEELKIFGSIRAAVD